MGTLTDVILGSSEKSPPPLHTSYLGDTSSVFTAEHQGRPGQGENPHWAKDILCGFLNWCCWPLAAMILGSDLQVDEVETRRKLKSLKIEDLSLAREMDQWIEVLAAKPDT